MDDDARFFEVSVVQIGSIWRIVTFFCLLQSFVCACAYASPQQAAQSVVRIFILDSKGQPKASGSGFVVANNGTIVTNSHVLSDLNIGDQIVVFKNGRKTQFQARLIKEFPSKDVAVLKVDGLAAAALTLYDGPVPSLTRVVAIGFPGVSDRIVAVSDELVNASFSDGSVSRTILGSWSGSETIKIIQHGATTSPGNSGGPLIDNCGRVVGVNTMIPSQRIRMRDGNMEVEASTGVNWASAASETAQLLRSIGISPRSTNKPCARAWGTSDNIEPPTIATDKIDQLEQAKRIAESRARQAEVQLDKAKAKVKALEANTKNSNTISPSPKKDKSVEKNPVETEGSSATTKGNDGPDYATVPDISNRFLNLPFWAWLVMSVLSLAAFGLALVLRATKSKVAETGIKPNQENNPPRQEINQPESRPHEPRSLEIIPEGILAGPRTTFKLSGSSLARREGIIIGRQVGDVDHVLMDLQIGRRHARLAQDGKDITLEDLGSVNGTFLNGNPLTAHKPEKLRSGDQITFATSETFTFRRL